MLANDTVAAAEYRPELRQFVWRPPFLLMSIQILRGEAHTRRAFFCPDRGFQRISDTTRVSSYSWCLLEMTSTALALSVRVRLIYPEDRSSGNEVFLKGDFLVPLSCLYSLYSVQVIHRRSPFSSICRQGFDFRSLKKCSIRAWIR